MRDALLAVLALTLFAVLSSPSLADASAKAHADSSAKAHADPSAKAQGKAKGQDNPTILIDRDRDGRVDMDVEVPISVDAFSVGERNLIVEYYRETSPAPRAVSPATRDLSSATRDLPPGIAKKVARGKALPPGIAKNYLPSDLESRLPARDGYRRMIVDNDVLLTAIATGVVVDIIENVLN